LLQSLSDIAKGEEEFNDEILTSRTGKERKTLTEHH
jgi:hypothetical protein